MISLSLKPRRLIFSEAIYEEMLVSYLSKRPSTQSARSTGLYSIFDNNFESESAKTFYETSLSQFSSVLQRVYIAIFKGFVSLYARFSKISRNNLYKNGNEAPS